MPAGIVCSIQLIDWLSKLRKGVKQMTVGPFTGSPSEYADNYRALVWDKRYSLETLNKMNHLALEHRLIGLDHFQAAARVLADEILKR